MSPKESESEQSNTQVGEQQLPQQTKMSASTQRRLPDEILRKIADACVDPYKIILRPSPDVESCKLDPNTSKHETKQPYTLTLPASPLNIKLSNSFFNVEIRNAVRRNFSGVILDFSECENIIQMIQKYHPGLLPAIKFFGTSFDAYTINLNPPLDLLPNLKLIQIHLNFTLKRPLDELEDECFELHEILHPDESSFHWGSSYDIYLQGGGKIRYQHIVTQSFISEDGQNIAEGPQAIRCAVELTRIGVVWMMGLVSAESKKIFDEVKRYRL